MSFADVSSIDKKSICDSSVNDGVCPGVIPASYCSTLIQGDGNVVTYIKDGGPIWATGTDGKGVGPYKLIMQGDGNLVMYDSKGTPYWASNTNNQGTAPYKAVMHENCNFKVYDSKGNNLWQSGTILTQDQLIKIQADIACKNAAPNSALASSCACKKAQENLSSALKTYQDGIKKNEQNRLDFKAKQTQYGIDLQNRQMKRDAKKADLGNETFDGKCTFGGGAGDCPTGWHSDQEIGGCAFASMQTRCRRLQSQIETEILSWDTNNPAPKEIGNFTPDLLYPPSGNTVSCCSQDFSGITADSANFSNITQNCGVKINNDIVNATPTTVVPINSTTSTPINIPTSLDTTPVVKDTTSQTSIIFYIGIGVIVLFILFLMFRKSPQNYQGYQRVFQ